MKEGQTKNPRNHNKVNNMNAKQRKRNKKKTVTKICNGSIQRV